MNEYLVPKFCLNYKMAVVEEESFRICNTDLKLCSLFENAVWYFSSGFQSSTEFVWVFVSFVSLCEFAGWEMASRSVSILWVLELLLS